MVLSLPILSYVYLRCTRFSHTLLNSRHFIFFVSFLTYYFTSLLLLNKKKYCSFRALFHVDKLRIEIRASRGRQQQQNEASSSSFIPLQNSFFFSLSILFASSKKGGLNIFSVCVYPFSNLLRVFRRCLRFPRYPLTEDSDRGTIATAPRGKVSFRRRRRATSHRPKYKIILKKTEQKPRAT